MKFFAQFAVLLQLALLSQVFARPYRLDSRILEPSETDLRLNDTGELMGELFDGRGQLKRSARIDLQSRQNPGFDFSSSKCTPR